MKRFLARAVELTIWLAIILLFLTDWLFRSRNVAQSQRQAARSRSFTRQR